MTTLHVKNNSSQAVITYITLGATAGCVQDVSQLITDGNPITKMYPLMGHFELPAGATVTLSAPNNEGLNGNFSFGTPPLNCPTPQLPNGVVLAEFIINNGFQQNGQETIDISCVPGVNALLAFEMSSTDWTSNWGKITSVQKIENSTKLNNTDRVGVFPYGCDNCTSSDNPPECVGKQSKYANKEPICNVQRPAGNNQGGTLTLVFNGYI